jgi:hypothetical protein
MSPTRDRVVLYPSKGQGCSHRETRILQQRSETISNVLFENSRHLCFLIRNAGPERIDFRRTRRADNKR